MLDDQICNICISHESNVEELEYKKDYLISMYLNYNF